MRTQKVAYQKNFRGTATHVLVNSAKFKSRYTAAITAVFLSNTAPDKTSILKGGTTMAYFNPHADALCTEDIDALRQVFDQFCKTHQTTGSDADMQICAAAIVRLYQSGERDPVVLTRACETALRQDFPVAHTG
jgi:hypothetical protein